MTAVPVPGPESSPLPPVLLPQGVRYLIVLAVVSVWMALGTVLHLDPNSYLLLGVPLLLFFQVAIARRPISELWVRPAAPAAFVWWSVPVAILFMVAPILGLVGRWAGASWPVRLWYMCALLGAVPLAFTFTRFSRRVLKSLLLCLATAGTLGVGYMVLTAMLRDRLHAPSGADLMYGGQQFLLYVTVCFVLEEVFFRGGLDSFLHRPGDRWPWLSAAFISVLWGLWHIPISPARSWAQVLVLAAIFPLVHALPGIPLSFFWRRSGSLMVPAIVHAFIDAARNVLLR